MKRALLVIMAIAIIYSLPSCKKDTPASPGKSTEKIKEINACANPPLFVGVRTVGGLKNEYGRTLTIDPNGEVTVSGVFQGTVDFDPGAGVFNLNAPRKIIGNTTYLYGLFNQRSNSSGNFLSAEMPGYYTNYENAVFDDEGNKYVSASEDASGGSGPAYLSVIKYNAAGAQLGKVYTDTLQYQGLGNIIYVSRGYVYISTPNGKLFKYTTNGGLIWKKLPGISLSNILTDDSDNIYLAGVYSGYVQKYNSSGDLLWTVNNGGGSYHVRTSLITADAGGAIYIAGTFDTDTDFLPGPNTNILTSSGSQNTYIQKLTPSGNYIWAVQTKGTVTADSAQPYDLEFDAGGTNIYVTGRLTGKVNFNTSGGTANVQSNGSGDVFVIRLNQCK